MKVQYDRTSAESFDKYIKKGKIKLGLKVAIITTIVILLLIVMRLIAMGVLIAYLSSDGAKAEVYENTDVNHYLWYMGEDAKEDYTHKWGMDESVFPAEITDEMNVLDYKMVYYNPWDAQYLSYLIVEYDDEHYFSEIRRLASLESKEYRGYFGADGFADEYTLLAMEANPDFGLIYALSTEEHQIIYVELIFCNYFMDMDYKSMIREEYLPVGFDATLNNLYRKQKLNKQNLNISMTKPIKC